MEKFLLPKALDDMLCGKTYVIDEIGMSNSTVVTFENEVLKIEKYSISVDHAVEMMRWLSPFVPVPQVLYYTVEADQSYLLMSRIHGKMCCDPYYLERPKEMVPLMAQGLKMLWDVDVSDCPIQRTLRDDLRHARYRVENRLIDVLNFHPEAFVWESFGTPFQLLEWLEEHQPSYEPVLSHGDYCLPNVLLQNGKISGFIDLGYAGVADKYVDIADCYRSLKHNFNGTFGGKVYADFDPSSLFRHLDVDLDKVRYYLLLGLLL